MADVRFQPVHGSLLELQEKLRAELARNPFVNHPPSDRPDDDGGGPEDRPPPDAGPPQDRPA